MKFYNGDRCKKGTSVGLFIWGCIILTPGLFLLTQSDTVIVSLFVLVIPGILMFVLGLVKMIKSIKRNNETVDYNLWIAEHTDNNDQPAFSVQCPKCAGIIEYDQSGIDGTRAWYPNGFVLCPKCNAPIRHKIENRITRQIPAPVMGKRFCSFCGSELKPGYSFCTECGAKNN